LSTLAINGSSRVEGGGRLSLVVRYADLGLLALALPLFVVFGFSILGYAVCAAAWLAGRAMHLAAERHAAASLGKGNRRGAMGTMAAATLGRVWLLALAILIVGLADREAGLAAAVLAAAVVTTYFAGQGIGRLLEPEGEGS
jgi:hypothetical protein